MDQQKVGKLIASIRKEKNLTQAQLGEKLGVTDKTISKWENGMYMPDLSLLKPLSEILEVSIYELLDGEKAKVTNIEKSKGDVLVDALKAYVSSVKKSMLQKGAIIIISTVMLLLFIIGFMLVINNYDNCHIYSITSEDERYSVKGLFNLTPEKNILTINSIENISNYDLDMDMVYAYEYTLELNDNVLFREGNISIYEYDSDAIPMYLNDILTDIKLYIDEDKNYNEIFNFSDYNNIKIKINYINQNNEKNAFEIPLLFEKLFSNNKVSYDGGDNF